MDKNSEKNGSSGTSLPPPVIPDPDRESVWRLLWYLSTHFSWNSWVGLNQSIMQKLKNPGISNLQSLCFQDVEIRHTGDSPEFQDRNDRQVRGYLSRTHVKDLTEKSVKSFNPINP